MNQIATDALRAFDRAVESAGDFTPRTGQRKMAQLVADTLSEGTLGEAPTTERAIAVIQAGTGVGKSLAASLPAIIAAQKRGARVIISTASVALQEQLIHKDLPRFSQLLEAPFTFALAKGRARYVCKLKLNRMAGGVGAGAEGGDEDLFDDDEFETPDGKAAKPAAPQHSTVVLYKELMKELDSGQWNGDKDSLDIPESALHWHRIAAESSTCTGRHCPQYNQCTYYEARKQLASATVIVANHDLLMAALGAKLLPELSKSLLVLDEAHELPQVASGHYSGSIELTSLRWLDQLAQRLQKVGSEVNYDSTTEAVKLTRDIKQAMSDLQGLVMSLYGSVVSDKDKTARLPHGEIPAALVEPLAYLHTTSTALAKHMSALAEVLNTKIRNEPENASRIATLYAAMGAMAQKLDAVVETADMLTSHKEEPDAKWFSFGDDKGYVRVTAHASPLIPGKLLVNRFWSQVRSAVVTSATLTSCDSFEFFLREVGLDQDPDVNTLKVQSPFDFAQQGRLVIVKTDSSPRDIEAYNKEMIGEFMVDAARITSGAMALFTSRSHLEQTHSCLPPGLVERVLLQGSMSRSALLTEHKRRIDAGEPSIIMGLQSFGQGVDLPGRYCETVFIAKLPFQPPNDPIGQARSEWLETKNRNAFNELSVPATSVRLNQWAGRLIRSESDQGTVICYDKRLSDTAYGRRILKGMPPFKRVQRALGEEFA